MDLSLERIEEAVRVIDASLLNTPQFSDPMLSEALGRDDRRQNGERQPAR